MIKGNLSKPFTVAAFSAALLMSAKQSKHVHGEATLDIAVEGKSAQIRFHSPSESIFGFEHAPKSKAEQKAVLQAKQIFLSQPDRLLKFAAEANCKIDTVNWEAFKDEDHNHHDQEHDKEHGKKHSKHDDHDHHKENENSQKNSKSSDKQRGHDHHDHGDGHSDLKVEFKVDCSKELKNTSLGFGFTSQFPRLSTIKVTYLSDSKQTGVTVKNDQPNLDL